MPRSFVIRLVAAACVAAACAAAMPAAVGAQPMTVKVPGGTVRVMDMPEQETVVFTLVQESTQGMFVPDIDSGHCPSGEVIITAEKQSRLQKMYRKAGHEKGIAAGVQLDGSPCRVWLNARSLRKLDEAELCNLVRHELGHARGLEHTEGGIMAPTISFYPQEGCGWAYSAFIDGAADDQ